MKNYLKNFLFRIKHGYSRSELWNLDYTIAEFTLPRLREFKNLHYGVPCELTYDIGMDKGSELWDSIIDHIIFSLEVTLDESSFIKWESISSNNLNEIYSLVNEGLELFGVFFRDLWS